MSISTRILDRATREAFDELSNRLATLAGAGVAEIAETNVAGVQKIGSLFKTTILVDLPGQVHDPRGPDRAELRWHRGRRDR